jgi:hypothetical protein
MPDEQSEKMVRLLEEIRDLTKERNEKLEAMLQTSRQGHDDAKKRYEDVLQQQKDARERSWTTPTVSLDSDAASFSSDRFTRLSRVLGDTQVGAERFGEMDAADADD